MKLRTYSIRHGDTLGALAKAFGIPLKQLLIVNPQISNPNLVRVGESILVPDAAPAVSVHAQLSAANDPSTDPAWLKIAYRELGTAEVDGPGNNPRILEYHATTSLAKKQALRDETAWCSSFVNWCVEQAGINGTDSAWALDWKTWGKELAQPRRGCIVVFSRKGLTSGGGHVGFYLSDTKDTVEVLGGNQGNAVKVSRYPKNGVLGSFKYRQLAYRWL